MLSVNFTICLKNVILQTQLILLSPNRPNLFNVCLGKDIALIDDFRIPSPFQSKPLKAILIHSFFAQQFIPHIAQHGARLNNELFRIFLKGPIGVITLHHKILVVEYKIGKLCLAQRLFINSHIPYVITPQEGSLERNISVNIDL